jgi:hypothetical protein
MKTETEITVDSIFDRILEDDELREKNGKDFQMVRHYYDRKDQGAVEIDDENMITVNVNGGKIEIDRYRDGFAFAFTEPKSIEEAYTNVIYFIMSGRLPDEEAI